MPLDDYEIERELGRGAMGVVHAGTHKTLGRRVAIKILRGARDAEATERFLREGRAVAAINHANVIEIYESGSDDAQVFQVLEFLEGESLATRLARGALPIREALDIAVQLLTGLREVHEHGIVHRDLKPENVFLIEDRHRPFGVRVKLLDFGIVKLATTISDQHLTATGSLLGTPSYMSPEQCEGIRSLDHRSDLYSLGCVLFEMLAGKRPFDAPALAAVIAMQLHEPPPKLAALRKEVSPGLEAIVARLLAKPVAERYPDADAVLAAFVQLAKTPAPPPPREKPRRLLWVVLGAASIAAIAVPVAILAGRGGAGSDAVAAKAPANAPRAVTSAPPDAPQVAVATPLPVPTPPDAPPPPAPPAPPPAPTPPALARPHAKSSIDPIMDELIVLRRAGLAGDKRKLDLATREHLAAHPKRRTEIEVLHDAANDLAERRANRHGGGLPPMVELAVEAFVAGQYQNTVVMCAHADHLTPDMIRPCVLAACLAGDATNARKWQGDLGDYAPGREIRAACTGVL